MITKRSVFIYIAVALLIGASVSVGVLIGRRQAPVIAPPNPATGEAQPSKEGKEEAAAEVSDLDRPLSELGAARCEHGISQLQCDECRYELGMVKLAPELFGDKSLIRTTKPSLQTISEERSLPGEVGMDETRTVHVGSPLAGSIVRSFAAPGRKVAAGAPLFEVDSPEAAEARSAYLKSLAGLTLARKTAEREALLFAKKIVAAMEVQEAEARLAEAETEVAAGRGTLLRLGLSGADVTALSEAGPSGISGLITIRAPRSGQVVEGHANPGEYAEAGKEVMTTSDPDSLWIMADLREADLATLNSGVGVKAEVIALGRTFPAHFEQVLGQVSEATRTARARFSVRAEGGLLRPGMFVSVRLLLPAGASTLVVPKAAVLADGGRTFVFVHYQGDFWVRRPVTLGRRSGEMVEVAGDLKPEQRIIADGSFLLKSDVLRSKMGAGCAD
jgi:cobalt-zinc-cadmium efflux system membrane fusion protein